jgi:hypothetical protein
VESVADTAAREQGKDIIARQSDGRLLWVTVKGFPERSANVQARHWFAGALLDMARYRDESEDALLGMGLPQGFQTYEGLIERTRRVRNFLRFDVFWVTANGLVERQRAAA